MYQGFSAIPPYGLRATQSFKAVGVAVVTLAGVSKFSGSGSLIGEGVATLVGSLGNIGGFDQAVGEAYIAPASVNQLLADLGEAIGEAYSVIGVGPNILYENIVTSDPSSGQYKIDEINLDADKKLVITHNDAAES